MNIEGVLSLVRHLLGRLVISHVGADQVEQNDAKHWYVVLTKPRHEETAHFHLASKRIDVFYPKLFLPVPTRSGRHIIPLFPNYIFVRIDALSPEYSQVLWCRGVKRLVSFGGAPSVVDDEVVNFMRELANPQGLITAKSNLKIGDEVQIVKGPFKGLIGIIQEPPDTKSRVKVLMAILSRNVRVEVPTDCIHMSWIAICPTV
jgi:transcriptional antiterminator RfaH